jgi:hypothetical protein
MPLSEEAKAELREAVRIVREDRFEKHARGILSGFQPKTPDPKDPPKDPADPPKDPADPPKKDDPNDPPKVRKSGYWGELLDD